ncbi:hypothetical protein P0136_01315 [Lentisphaerota bacterium ZTH]|nr:hypothetical protein JYG24_07545 [Lentisphaerota bacterium]WET06653.1 hypothetical protein P0136_01315 [Lentisphaerota bacterium ZTH]
MLENRYKEAIVIKNPTGNYIDGKPELVSYSARAVITDFSRRELDRFGTVKDGRVFLIKSKVLPLPGARIEHKNTVYDLKDIKICRAIDGRIEACRCVVF